MKKVRKIDVVQSNVNKNRKKLQHIAESVRNMKVRNQVLICKSVTIQD